METTISISVTQTPVQEQTQIQDSVLQLYQTQQNQQAVNNILNIATLPSTMTIMPSDPSLKDPAITRLIEQKKEWAAAARAETDPVCNSPEEIIAKYKQEFAAHVTQRSDFYLQHEREACIAAGVPIVQIPDSVIYQLTHLSGQDDSSAYIDTICHQSSNQACIDTLIAQLEDLNRDIDNEKKKLDGLFKEMLIQSGRNAATYKKPVELESLVMVNLTNTQLAYLRQNNEALVNLNYPAPDGTEAPDTFESHKKQVTECSLRITALSNERSDVQSKLLLAQSKALNESKMNPSRVLSGEEIVSNYIHSTFFDD